MIKLRTNPAVFLIACLLIILPVHDLLVKHGDPWVRLGEYYLNYWQHYPLAVTAELLWLWCGIGLLRLKNWARVGTVFICWLMVVFIISSYLNGSGNQVFLKNLPGLIILLLIIFLFSRPKIKNLFISQPN